MKKALHYLEHALKRSKEEGHRLLDLQKEKEKELQVVHLQLANIGDEVDELQRAIKAIKTLDDTN